MQPQVPQIHDSPETRQVLPYLGLYIVIPLVPEKLRNVDFGVYHDVEASHLQNGRWTVASGNAHSTARIFDSTTPFLANGGRFRTLDLTSMTSQHQRYFWRLPVGISSILASALEHASPRYSGSRCEEIYLTRQLHALL